MNVHASVVVCVCAVVGVGGEHARDVKVSGIRATLGLRSGTAALEKICYSSGSTAPTGNRLRLHLTIDQSFKDRLAQAKKTTSGGGQWSPISLAPDCCLPAITPHKNVHDCLDAGNADDIFDLASILQDVAAGPESYSEQTTMEACGASGSLAVESSSATPADLSDISAVDLLHFPADWTLQLSDFDVNADFTALTDNIVPPTLTADLALPSLLPPTSSTHHDQSGFLAAPQPPVMSEPFPVYDDVIGAYPVGDVAPMFDVVDDFWWNTSNMAHAISVQ